MNRDDRQTRLNAMLDGTAAEYHTKSASFSLRRQSHEQTGIRSRDTNDTLLRGQTPPVDLIRNRVSDPQRPRLSAMSRPSPLSRGYHISSSPIPPDDYAHIPTQARM
ncbi:hypothetical protein BDY19DRAFT_573150 [Irpex rosettiformis]|uniref:Uncharacterized protein n=1 Tax=Irpex rosettiformis TaxID=378272 RepID=A0ACB8UCL6_9APHY|nr:hypothetical protein BDY19DRAFT_573150 [Irpex rosettiformis]